MFWLSAEVKVNYSECNHTKRRHSPAPCPVQGWLLTCSAVSQRAMRVHGNPADFSLLSLSDAKPLKFLLCAAANEPHCLDWKWRTGGTAEVSLVSWISKMWTEMVDVSKYRHVKLSFLSLCFPFFSLAASMTHVMILWFTHWERWNLTALCFILQNNQEVLCMVLGEGLDFVWFKKPLWIWLQRGFKRYTWTRAGGAPQSRARPGLGPLVLMCHCLRDELQRCGALWARGQRCWPWQFDP